MSLTTPLNDQAIHYGISELQELCGSTAASKGFHDDRPKAEDYWKSADHQKELNNWQGNKLLLIVSEVIEAHDEIRSGHAADQTYYPTINAMPGSYDPAYAVGKHKPEGVPSEIADAVIRCFDFAYTEGFSLADIILEKLQFNSQRPYKHGRSF